MEEKESLSLNDLISAHGETSPKIVEMLREATYVGIDFGTSTTTITRLEYDTELRRVVSRELPIAQEDSMGISSESHLVPTVIAMSGSDGHLLFGSGAKACLGIERGCAEGFNYWSEFKMHLGECACYPHTRMSRNNTPDADIVIEPPKDATKQFFAYLKRAIEDAVERDSLPNDIRYAVTVPASFAPNQRKELCEAVKDAGIVLHQGALLDEPNAAFIAAAAQYAEYGGIDVFFRRGDVCNVLVFDYGAGTCDISLLGVHSDMRIQSIAISRFTALGGRDIDMRIAEDVLYPKLIEGRTGDDIPVKSVREHILNTLKPFAERMKINMSRKFLSDFGESAYRRAANNPDTHVEERFRLETKRYGVFENPALQLTAGEFMDVMKSFSQDPEDAFESGNKSVLEPIADVLRKGNMTKEEIDFVLMVGGSSENPFIRETIENYFGGSVQISETNLSRTLVARGAAFHSLAANGFEVSCVTPITSEDIVIKTGVGSKLVVRAGTPVPTENVEVDGLFIDAESRDTGLFGIPFYARQGDRKIGTAKFMLGNMKGEHDVRLTCSLSAEKVFAYEIEVEGVRFSGQFDMPVSSEDVSDDEVAYIRAVNSLQHAALANNGVPSSRDYYLAAKACEKIQRYEEAAEFYRNLMYEHRNSHYEAEVANNYREAAKRTEALEWARRAVAYRKSSYNIWYLIWDLVAVKGWSDEEVGKWVLYAITTWPDDLDFRYVDMKAHFAKGFTAEGNRIAEELYSEWEAEGVENVDKYQLPRFHEVARLTGHREMMAKIVRKQKTYNTVDDDDDGDDNVTMIRLRGEGENER